MKPRLQSQPMTVEDAIVWEAAVHPSMTDDAYAALIARYILADRRDADLMLFIGESTGQMRVDHPGDPDGDFSAVLFPRAWADPRNWKPVLVKMPDGSWVEPT